MNRVLRALLVEDSEDDVLLTAHEIESAGYFLSYERVDTKEQLISSLSHNIWDVILSDFTMPKFNGMQALKTVREINHEIPFIFVSGTIGEERAVQAIKSGANDYVIKDNLKRLVPTIERELQEVKNKKAHEASLIALAEAKEKFYNSFHYSIIGMALVSVDFTFLEINKTICDMLGYNHAELMQLKILDLIHSDSQNDFKKAIGLIKEKKFYSKDIELRIVNKNGYVLWGVINISLVNPKNKSSYFIIHLQDITKEKLADEKLKNLTMRDMLTGLPNRYSLINYLNKVIDIKKKHKFAILVLNLDRFKLINDNYCLLVGDNLLKVLAKRLQNKIYEENNKNIISRISGTEFAIILRGVKNKKHILNFVTNIRKLLLNPISLSKEEFILTASIGISLYPDDDKDGYNLLEKAIRAMHSVERKGGDNYTFYDDKISEHINIFQIERDLRTAVANNEFIAHYQPQFSADGNYISGFEALARWKKNDKIIFPEEFISIAEDTGIIVDIGNKILKESCEFYVYLRKKNKINESTRVAVNISPRQLANKNLLDYIENIISSTGINPKCLELEITENILINDFDLSVKIINSLIDLNIIITIDDFGTGYSSLNYLKHFKVQRLKIDKSFVHSLTIEQNSRSIIKSIISLAHGMGIKVIAEGVETKEQYDFLVKNKCDEFQGFYFSRPLDQNGIEKFL